ncbi:unnamed protein product [Arctia plantaginis]|uniref:Uncharacterized protein n=1 Tax=Arctia plantaginis TaxID=874455 RepID=A0A8S0YTS2_ARCPL|nr:unnamed protein product [Arctia plantaginis]
MCEIFPEVNYCCYFCSLRVGILFIAVASIMTGGAILSGLENDAEASYEQSTTMIQAGSIVVENTDLLFLYRHLLDFVITALTIHGFAFVIAGFFLLVADLIDESGFAQVFVWLTLLNIIFGTVALLAMGVHCTLKETRCLLNMDWLESAVFIVSCFFYYALYFYFIMVANSYVVNGDTTVEIK